MKSYTILLEEKRVNIVKNTCTTKKASLQIQCTQPITNGIFTKIRTKKVYTPQQTNP